MNDTACSVEQSWPILMYYPCICLKALKKTINDLRQGSSYLGSDMNPGPPNWKQERTKKNNHNQEVKFIHISRSCDRLTTPEEKGFAGFFF
jgi:hypothetical protein